MSHKVSVDFDTKGGNCMPLQNLPQYFIKFIPGCNCENLRKKPTLCPSFVVRDKPPAATHCFIVLA